MVGRARGKTLSTLLTPELTRDCYIPVTREQGEFLYLTARALAARNVLEFGTSFGISTIYLAAAVRDNGAGVVIGSEIESSKCAEASRNLDEVLRLLQPRFRAGAVVLADNIHTFRRSLRPYVEYVQSPGGGFVSTRLSMGHGFEYSVYLGRSRGADD